LPALSVAKFGRAGGHAKDLAAREKWGGFLTVVISLGKITCYGLPLSQGVGGVLTTSGIGMLLHLALISISALEQPRQS
jgi:hypothetical protein